MFVTPVVYPSSMVPQRWAWLMALNPMAAIINTFRHAFHGVGNFDIGQLLVSMAVTATILAMGVLLFSRIEKSFMDTI
jgi:lipopolysaccharide transport system permease protein